MVAMVDATRRYSSLCKINAKLPAIILSSKIKAKNLPGWLFLMSCSQSIKFIFRHRTEEMLLEILSLKALSSLVDQSLAVQSSRIASYWVDNLFLGSRTFLCIPLLFSSLFSRRRRRPFSSRKASQT